MGGWGGGGDGGGSGEDLHPRHEESIQETHSMSPVPSRECLAPQHSLFKVLYMFLSMGTQMCVCVDLCKSVSSQLNFKSQRQGIFKY